MSIFVAIQDPIIQKFAIRIAGGYISQKTGAEVKIGRLYISPNFTIHIDHFSVKDLKSTDLINVKELKVRPIMEELIRGNIHLSRVELNHAKANLITYEGEDQMNYQFLIDAFSSDDQDEESTTSTTIKVDRVILNGLDFQMWDQNNDDTLMTANHEMDFSHIALKDINLDVEGLAIIGDSINAIINHLSANEMSGFSLNKLKSNIIVSPSGIMMDSLNVETQNSQLDLDLHMAFNGYSALSSFVDSVNIDANIHPSTIMVSDFGPFSSTLYEMTDPIKLEGRMKGPIQSFTVDDMVLALGERTQFRGNIALEPLNFEKGKQQLNIKNLNYSYDDLANFHVPISSGTIPIPSALAPLGRGTIKGSFSGTLDKFKTNLDVTSEIGNVSAILDKHVNELHYDVYEGHVIADSLNVGILADVSDIIGTLDMDAHVIARLSPTNDIDLDIEGSVSDAMLKGNNINEIALNGNLHKNCFNGNLSVDDEELKLDFNGRFDFNDPDALGGDFTAEIKSADLQKLNLVDQETCTLKASITANMKSINDFNNAEGKLSISNFTYVDNSGEYVMDRFEAKITNDNVVHKRINVNSDYLDLTLAGQMDFNGIGESFKQFVNSYATLFETDDKSPQQDILFDVKIKKPNQITKLLRMPELTIAENTTLAGNFTSRYRALNLTLRSDYVRYHVEQLDDDIRINNIELKGKSSPQKLTTDLKIDEIVLLDSTDSNPTVIGLDQFLLNASLQNGSINTALSWDDLSLEDHNRATILSSIIPKAEDNTRISINYADIVLNDSSWTFTENNFVEFDDSKIRISNLGLLSNSQSLVLDGYAPMHQDDTLHVVMDHFNISTFDFLLKRFIGFDLDGSISGNATINDLSEDMTILADLDIKDFGLDGQPYGDLDVNSRWNNEQNSIELDIGLTNEEQQVVSLQGSYYLSDGLDLNLDVDGMPLSIVSPFVSDLAQRFQGTCLGHLDIKGATDNLDIQGEVKVKDGGCQINLLNTFYTFSPIITLTDKLIKLSHLSLTDTLGNSAYVIGQITHDHLDDFDLDIKLYPKNFLVMATNATHSSTYYGTAIADGIVEIKGPIDDLTINVIRAVTKKGTSITLPLDGSSSVYQHEFITFVSKKTEEVDEETADASTPQEEKEESSNVNINLDIDVNNDAQIKIVLPDGLGTMEAKGDGNIKLNTATLDGSLSLIGDYIISSGSLSLNMQDVIKRNFSLDPGSRISWTGDPINGTINATGVYQTKAPISSLGLIDSTSMGSSNIKVECLVHLKHKLLNPDISFGLRLPNASEDLQQTVFYVIDTTNQSEVFLQVVNLLVFNSFSYGSSLNSLGIITSQMNDFISQFTEDIDINFNYRAGDDLSNQEMTVDLRKQLFDDRLTIETNFGVVRPTSAYASNSTNIIGDVNIDYKITKDGRWSVQGFNRSNYNTSLYQYTYYKMAPYTQGIGISYQKSFDRWRDLFKKQTTGNLAPPPTNPNGPISPIIDIQRPPSVKRPNQENNEPTE